MFAAPGSGKTTVLTHHIVHQLDQKTVRSDGVLLITFTRQAAAELKQRVAHIACQNKKKVAAMRIGTFHAESFRMLLQAGVTVRPVLGQHEQRALFRQALRESGLLHGVNGNHFEQLLTLARSQAPAAALPRRYRQAGLRYQVLKEKAGVWDFDDITERFCQASAEILEHVPEIQYVLVDEFQDTNSAQWFILSQLVRHFHCRVFVVGDDDQAIYGFRGASPQWLLEAAERIPHTSIQYLETNFRSDVEIVRTSSSLIRHNRLRMDKSFTSNRQVPGLARYVFVTNEVAEAMLVDKFLNQVLSTQPKHSLAVLARTRRQLYNVMSTVTDLAVRHAVTWATFHGAKGQEWDVVVIVGAVANNPYLLEVPSDEEEERRLFYVAMTRARHALWITVPHRLLAAPVQPSRFLKEGQVGEAESFAVPSPEVDVD